MRYPVHRGPRGKILPARDGVRNSAVGCGAHSMTKRGDDLVIMGGIRVTFSQLTERSFHLSLLDNRTGMPCKNNPPCYLTPCEYIYKTNPRRGPCPRPAADAPRQRCTVTGDPLVLAGAAPPPGETRHDEIDRWIEKRADQPRTTREDLVSRSIHSTTPVQRSKSTPRAWGAAPPQGLRRAWPGASRKA